MKHRLIKTTAVLCAAMLLSACGSTNVSGVIESQMNGSSASEANSKSNAASDFDTSNYFEEEYDVDLTKLSSTMIYSQVYDMVYSSEDYVGKSVKVRDPFSYYQDPQTQQEYFAVLISDATACCSQGIEFVLGDEYKYPDDYPALNTEITVSGKFNYYKEGVNTYCQLTDAVLLEQ